MISEGAAMLGAAAIGAAGSAISGNQSARAAERNYKHRYQWQVKDLKKAGLNPMLAVSQGAPNVPQPQFENIGEGAIKGASAAAAARVASGQVKNLEADTELKGTAAALNIAQARESSIRAGISEASVPYAGASARENYWILAGTARKIQNDAEQISENIKITEQNYLHLQELQPLLREYQRLQNAVMRAELPGLEAEAAFWDALPEAAWVKQLRAILPSFPKGIFKKK